MLQNKLKSIGRITEMGSVSQSMYLKYIREYKAPTYKHSTSFNSESLVTGKSDNLGTLKVREYSKPNSNADDDMINLGRLSLINMKARDELLNANRMLVDLDVSLSVIYYCDRIENTE